MAQPTKEQLLENPHAKELHQICLDLVHGEDVEQEQLKRRPLES